jgi:hypothetical protein
MDIHLKYVFYFTKIEDIKHEKFKMAMFHSLPKQRPLYAVISTILEQSREKKDAEGAAEEYYKMKVLETTMIEQKMIPSVSIFVRLRSTTILKSISDFYVTDICTSYLCLFFKFSNRHPMTSLTFALSLTLTKKSAIDLRI